MNEMNIQHGDTWQLKDDPEKTVVIQRGAIADKDKSWSVEFCDEALAAISHDETRSMKEFFELYEPTRRTLIGWLEMSRANVFVLADTLKEAENEIERLKLQE